MKRYATPFMVLAAAAFLGLGLAGCGDDEDTASTDQQETEAADAATNAQAETVEVTAIDYGYEGLPAEIKAGTKLTLKNSSDKELHELVAIPLPASEKRSVAELLALPQSELEGLFTSEPPAVLLSMPKSDETIPAVGDGTLSEPGRYLIFCAIPTGADPAAYMAAAQAATDGPPQVAGGPPHFVQGMAAELRVN